MSVILLSFLILPGCGKTVTEKQTEKALEKQFGGNAKVDVNNDSVSVVTDQGTFQAGGKVKLPVGFPKDVYIIDGELMTAMSDSTSGSFQVAIKSTKSLSDAKKLYDEKLKSDGWTIKSTYDYNNTGVLISAEKDTRAISVMLGTEAGVEGLTVSLTVTKASN